MMPRRRTRTYQPILTEEQLDSEDYWLNFLRSKGLYSKTMVGLIVKPEISEAESTVARDPMFAKFLHYASKYGAPANYSQFRKLPPQERLYYLKAYEEWLKNIRRKGIKV